ncbi:hypothetical protein [Promicromonospora sp. NPDC023987]|uniref:hypothetical protein n=1 Tax=Promicromonospora sp. NPDC023987 TaxID=3155360 RepID=UPI0033F246F8
MHRTLQATCQMPHRERDVSLRTYLEAKSDLDLSSKLGVAKVAKFLLGAANRQPAEAAHYL